MPISPPLESSGRQIAAALTAFLRHGRLAHVSVAECVATTPPALAYLVHFPRLSVTLSGKDSMWVEQGGKPRLLALEKGDAAIIPANCWNRPVWGPPATTLSILFGRRQVGLSLVTHDGKRPEPPPACKATLHGAHGDVPRQIMQALLGLPKDAPEIARPLIEALLRVSLAALNRPTEAPKRRAANLYDSICMYVQEHFQLPLSRESVAAHFHVSPNHVSRLFKREGEVSFNDYIAYVRIDRAKYLLKNYRQTIDEVAAACGFSEASYFCRVFKKKTKLTPTAYRQ
ncbi:MAG: helix-turn-helix transcriptional regulator [Opitutae bacterium]|nr:helix-turn-helix transcriptional regulator [Opitutae bacterium]